MAGGELDGQRAAHSPVRERRRARPAPERAVERLDVREPESERDLRERHVVVIRDVAKREIPPRLVEQGAERHPLSFEPTTERSVAHAQPASHRADGWMPVPELARRNLPDLCDQRRARSIAREPCTVSLTLSTSLYERT